MCSSEGRASGMADVGRLTPALDALLAVDVDALPDATLAADLVGLRAAVARLEAEFSRRLVAFDRRGAAGASGAVSTAAWLRAACRLDPGEATGRVRTARMLADVLPVTADALAAGAISYPHARVLAAAAPELPADRLAELEPVLVEAARHTGPGRLRSVLADLRAQGDPVGAEAAAEAAVLHRRLSVAGTFAGAVVIDGVLDPEAGATVLAALQPLAARAGADDVRSPAQRRADALVELCRRALDAGDLPVTGGERPHLQVRVDLATLCSGTGVAGVDWTGPLSAGAALRLACDARITPVLTAGGSEVLDLGRSVRLVSPAQRRALAWRDGGCVWPDCDRPPAYTDAHHLRHWIEGGGTDLANLALICRTHHRLVHTGWELAQGPDGCWHTIPPGTASPGRDGSVASRGP